MICPAFGKACISGESEPRRRILVNLGLHAGEKRGLVEMGCAVLGIVLRKVRLPAQPRIQSDAWSQLDSVAGIEAQVVHLRIPLSDVSLLKVAWKTQQ